MDGSNRRRGARLFVAFAAIAMLAAASAGSAAAGVGQKCPTFRVQHNDKIDGVSFPAGNYKMTVKRMACQSGTDYFRQFLANNQNDLPGTWRLNARTGTFLRDGSGKGFQVNLWR